MSLYSIGALAGTGGETVVERVTERAHRVHPTSPHEAGGGQGLAGSVPRVAMEASQARVGVQVRAAVIQIVLQGDVERGRMIWTRGRLLRWSLFLWIKQTHIN